MKIFNSILLVFTISTCYSQNQLPFLNWEKTYGGSTTDNLNVIIPASDGGYLLGGDTSSDDGDIQSGNLGQIDVWLVKIDDFGTLEWEKTFGSAFLDYLSFIEPTLDGGYLIGVQTFTNDDFGNLDFTLVKIDNLGTVVWEKTYGGSGSENLSVIQYTTDQGYLLGGSTRSNDGDVQSGNHGLYDYWLVKIDGTGAIQWEKTYGGSNNESLHSFLPLSNEGYLLFGTTTSDDGDIVSGHKGEYDIWIVQIDNNGTIQWEKTYGGSGIEHARAIIPIAGSSYLFLSVTTSNDGDIQSGNNGAEDSWFVKIDNQGNLEWEQTFGGSDLDVLKTILASSDGTYLLGGKTGSNDGDVHSGNNGLRDIWLVKVDNSGNLVWEKTYGGSAQDRLGSIINTSDSGYLFATGTDSNDGDIQSGNNGASDSWIVKLNNLGMIVWEQTYGGSGDDGLNNILPITNEDYLLTGFTTSNDGDVKSGNMGETDFWVVNMIVPQLLTWFVDTDGDGYGNLNITQLAYEQPLGFVDNSDDCNDSNGTINLDKIWYADSDGDGYGDIEVTQTACIQPSDFVDNSEDCDDTDSAVNPDKIWYADGDGDGYGDIEVTQTACIQPSDFVDNSEDCNDTDSIVNPDKIWFADSDGDGYGNIEVSQTACLQPSGFVVNSDDCDDTDSTINPDKIWFADSDEDGYGDVEVTQTACLQPSGFVDNSDDCDDTNDELTPDNNCNPVTRLQNIDLKNISIYPNPSSGFVLIEFGNIISTKVRARLISLEGKVFYDKSFFNQKELRISIPKTNESILILELTFKENKISERIVLE